uniref:Vacuolar ATPase assembly protein VMA22 n=1 Tax=Trichuris muris TaxID=70415 RepID=A0A5S6Q8E0_TRIMR
METSAQSCCNRQYDYFILDFLERLDIYVKKKLELERHLKNCWYYLAQTRLFMGSMSRVSELQFDFRDQPASVTLEVSEEGDHFQLSRTPTEEMKHRALKRFGILVPHSLKLAQVSVLTAVQLICEIAGLQAKINALIRELDSFK